MAYLIVFLGAGIGGALRHGANLGVARYGYAAPFATLLVNILGSFLIGALAGYFAYRTGISQHVRLFLTTGMLGGFTTFSTFSLDTALLIERHDYALAAGYAVGSVGIGIAAFFFGLALFETRSQLP